MIIVELHGLEIKGRHGAAEEERAREQLFLYDVSLQVSDASLSDRLEDTVDYERVAECVREVSASHRYTLIEALAAGVADAIAERFPVARVRVRVRKPEVRPAGLDVEWASATVERTS